MTNNDTTQTLDDLRTFTAEIREHEQAAQEFRSLPLVRHVLFLVLKQSISAKLHTAMLATADFVFPTLPESANAKRDNRTADERVGPPTRHLQTGPITLSYKCIVITTTDGQYKLNLDADRWTQHGYWDRQNPVAQLVAPDNTLYQSLNGDWQQIHRPIHTGRSCPEVKLELLRNLFGSKERALLRHLLAILVVMAMLAIALRIQIWLNLF